MGARAIGGPRPGARARRPARRRGGGGRRSGCRRSCRARGAAAAGPALAQRNPLLVYRDGEDRQAIVELAPQPGRATIGRAASCEVVLAWDREVSRVHAQLERVGEEWTVGDDGLSRNGSFVNGARLAGRVRLRDGDVLRVGRTLIAYRHPDPQESQATSIAGATAAAPELTPVQREVLVALCRPYRDDELAAPSSNGAIAAELHLSVDAIKGHLRMLFQRFGIEHLPQNQKRSRLAAEALRGGVVTARDLA